MKVPASHGPQGYNAAKSLGDLMKKEIAKRSHRNKVVTIQKKDLAIVVGGETTPWGIVIPDPPTPGS